jgi:two-component system sensor histidine kinase BaeS
VSELSAELAGQVVAGARLSGTATIDGQESFVAGRTVGGGLGLLLAVPVSSADNLAGDDRRRLVTAVLAGLFAAVLIGLFAARRVTRPLRSAADAAERMSAGERGRRVTPAGPTEVVDIAESLNRLSDSLAASEGRQREFLLSVSHELRTPLTAIRGYAEALSDGLAEDPAATGEVLTAEAGRLDRLVADLLDLARLGAVDVSIDAVAVDLVELTRRAAEVWRDRCRAVGVELRCELPDHPLGVLADPVRVRQIIDNLAENALRVTPAGAPVVLAVAAADRSVLLSVRDGGPGLTPADLAVAFEPAVLHSRYRGVRPVGTGVGLALVGRLATRMGGSARAWAAPEGGAAFGVWFPRVPQLAGTGDDGPA